MSFLPRFTRNDAGDSVPIHVRIAARNFCRRLASFLRAFSDSANVIPSQFGEAIVLSADVRNRGLATANMLPNAKRTNICDMSSQYTKFLCKIGGLFASGVAIANRNDLFLGKFGVSVTFTSQDFVVGRLIPQIVFDSIPAQIANAVIPAIVIIVTGYKVVRAWAYKRFQYHPMNGQVLLFTVNNRRHSQAVIARRVWLEKARGTRLSAGKVTPRANTAKVANLVTRASRDVSPFFGSKFFGSEWNVFWHRKSFLRPYSHQYTIRSANLQGGY